MCHSTNSMDEVSMVQVFEPVLVRVMSIGTTIEVVSQRVFNSILVVGILHKGQNACNNKDKKLTRYSSSLYMKGVMALPVLVRLLA